MADEGSGPELRASYDDREQVVEVLQAAAADGRLSAEEFDERLGAALAARTHGELARLTTDLPAAGRAGLVPPPEPKDVIRIDCQAGSAKRDGAWVVPRRIEVRVSGGAVTLDFTRAVITQPTLRIDAEVSTGSLTLVTTPGIIVDADDVTIRLGAVRVRPPDPGVRATLRIDVSGSVDTGTISARSSRAGRARRRTFWAWLLRRPRPPAITA